MMRSELLEKAITLAKNGVNYNPQSEETRELNKFALELFLAEQKRADGCAFCTKHGEEHSFSLDGEFLVDHSDYGDNSSLLVYYCPLCGRDLTDGESE